MDLSWLTTCLAIKNKHLTIIFSEDRMIELGKRFLRKELENPGYYNSLYDEWKGYEKEYHKICKKIDSLELDKLSLTELKELYIEFIEKYHKEWMIPLTANNISTYSEHFVIPKIIKKYGKKGIKDFIDISTPIKISFVKEEEKDLLKIAVLAKEGKDFKEELKKHADNYHWLKNNYRDGIRLGVDYFLDRLKEDLSKNPESKLKVLEEEKKVLEKKHKILPKKFTKEEKVLAHLIDKATTLQDLRKKSNMMGDYYVLEFLKVISKKTGYSFEELCYTNLKEIYKILSGKKVSGLKSRTKCCVNIIDIGYDEVFGGDEALKFYDIIDKVDDVKSEVLEIPGVSASLGKVKGIVRVVPDVSNVKVFNKGDILVASMTRPEYTSLMKKAGAVVTNEGGVTCHAAIVSRELNIPCIIGTKIATKVLKDGDLVEVDADKGVIKKL
ncbi:hypothetical protein CEE44_04730 [Candidatus Woesearchaeota archaeon B3_Woes]|nr:MAG: hypothetical protein CEE44_04730 [Candidatus Woesearchaeota archaeon B3_Woes]